MQSHGIWKTNAAMVAGQSLPVILKAARNIAGHRWLQSWGEDARITGRLIVAGPGFWNLRLSAADGRALRRGSGARELIFGPRRSRFQGAGGTRERLNLCIRPTRPARLHVGPHPRGGRSLGELRLASLL